MEGSNYIDWNIREAEIGGSPVEVSQDTLNFVRDQFPYTLTRVANAIAAPRIFLNGQVVVETSRRQARDHLVGEGFSLQAGQAIVAELERQMREEQRAD